MELLVKVGGLAPQPQDVSWQELRPCVCPVAEQLAEFSRSASSQYGKECAPRLHVSSQVLVSEVAPQTPLENRGRTRMWKMSRCPVCAAFLRAANLSTCRTTSTVELCPGRSNSEAGDSVYRSGLPARIVASTVARRLLVNVTVCL